MTLFGKTRAQEEPLEDSNPASSGDEGPPPYVYGDSAGQGVNDSKASIASSDDENKGNGIDYSLEELDPEAVWLDVVKADKHGSSIVRRGTSRDILYTMTKEKRITSPTRHLFHGSVPQDPGHRPANVLPYASVKTSSIFLYTPNEVEPTEYKRRDLFHMPKWYGIPSVFTVGDTEYRIRLLKRGWSAKLILTIANDTTKTPLCVFRPTKKLFTEIRSSIEILPMAISTSNAPKPHALLQNGQPTKLLDMAMIAESVVRLYQQQQNNSAIAAGAAA